MNAQSAALASLEHEDNKLMYAKALIDIKESINRGLFQTQIIAGSIPKAIRLCRILDCYGYKVEQDDRYVTVKW